MSRPVPLRMCDLLPALRSLDAPETSPGGSPERPESTFPARGRSRSPSPAQTHPSKNGPILKVYRTHTPKGTPARRSAHKASAKKRTPDRSRSSKCSLFTPDSQNVARHKRSTENAINVGSAKKDIFLAPSTKNINHHGDDGFEEDCRDAHDVSSDRGRPLWDSRTGNSHRHLKLSTPQSCNISSNAILREFREKDSASSLESDASRRHFTPQNRLDGNRLRTPLFPLKNNSFGSHCRSARKDLNCDLFTLEEKENDSPILLKDDFSSDSRPNSNLEVLPVQKINNDIDHHIQENPDSVERKMCSKFAENDSVESSEDSNCPSLNKNLVSLTKQKPDNCSNRSNLIVEPMNCPLDQKKEGNGEIVEEGARKIGNASEKKLYFPMRVPENNAKPSGVNYFPNRPNQNVQNQMTRGDADKNSRMPLKPIKNGSEDCDDNIPRNKIIIEEAKPVKPIIKQFKAMTIKGKSFTVLGKLGSGGSSDVFKVMDPEDSSMFAVKCVNLAVDSSVAESYINEIKLLQRLQGSDSVITMYNYEYVKHQKKLYVLLEIGDVDLSSLLKFYRSRGSSLPFPILIGYWTEMLNAVKHIHQNGIIHSDLKPANFLLVHGRLKLIDFGIASSLNADATSVMKDSTTGTFNYISPEAITMNNGRNATAKISYKSDVWSLGCILYSMLYGHTPFSHVTNLFAKIAVLSNPNQSIDYPPIKGVPPVLMKALQMCLTFDVKKRPSVQDLIDLPYINCYDAAPIQRDIDRDIPLTIISKIKAALLENEWQIIARILEASRK